MHDYSQTVSTTLLCALLGTPFALECMNIAGCVHHFCWLKTSALVLTALFILYKSKVWQRDYGPVLGAFAGFTSPFVAHLYLLFK